MEKVPIFRTAMITIDLPSGHQLQCTDLQALVLISKLVPGALESDAVKVTFRPQDIVRMIEVLDGFITGRGLPSLLETATIADVVTIVQKLAEGVANYANVQN